jgi:hypothetical protein
MTTTKTKPDPPTLPLEPQAVTTPKHQHPGNARGWYAPAKYLPNLFVPLAVLQTLSQIADDDGVCSLVEAKREMNNEILFAMLRMLTIMGHIDVVGERITIKSIPATKDSQ